MAYLPCVAAFQTLFDDECPSAIRAECAGCPLSINCFAYSCSTVPQGIRSASLTHSFSGSSSPNGKTKASNASGVSFLYIRPHASASFCWVLHAFPCTCIIPYGPFTCWFSYVLVVAERTLGIRKFYVLTGCSTTLFQHLCFRILIKS